MTTIEINGHEYNGYSLDDVEEVFGDIVKEELSNGYGFSLRSFSSGFQTGDINHVDLVKDNGNSVKRILFYREHLFAADPKYFWKDVDVYRIKVLKFENCAEKSTLWNDKGSEIRIISFYNIAHHSSDHLFFVDDINVAYDIKLIRYERSFKRINKNEVKLLPESSHKVACNLLKKIRGYGRTKLTDIVSVKRIGKQFYVTFKHNGKETGDYIS